MEAFERGDAVRSEYGETQGVTGFVKYVEHSARVIWYCNRLSCDCGPARNQGSHVSRSDELRGL